MPSSRQTALGTGARRDVVPFAELAGADLRLDCVYEGGTRGNAADDVIGKLLPVGNQGGFRVRGSIAQGKVSLIVLYTSGVERDWPDTLDPTTGDFTYYGDNRTAGADLHETPRRGNKLLRAIFAASRGSLADRQAVPPVLLFQNVGGRNVAFCGLLAPGSPRLGGDEELVALWRTTGERRFQNYRAHFTVLQTPVVSRSWVNEVLSGCALGPSCPPEWRTWVETRTYAALEAPRTAATRTKAEQLPTSDDLWMMETVHRHFQEAPTRFEQFAADMWQAFDSHVTSIDVTRPSRDGGRDALGEYRLGPRTDPIRLNFALEAKCYAPDGGGLGVKAVSRLISRIKHREFGVFVTTAFISSQAYQEVREDGHPIVFLTGRDLANIIRRIGIATPGELTQYLEAKYPVSSLRTPAVASSEVSRSVERDQG